MRGRHNLGNGPLSPNFSSLPPLNSNMTIADQENSLYPDDSGVGFQQVSFLKHVNSGLMSSAAGLTNHESSQILLDSLVKLKP